MRRLDRHLVVDEHVAGHDVLQLRHRAQVADAERLDRLAVLAVQEQDLPEALLRVRARIDERRVARDRAGEHAEAADATGERVGDRLEDEHRLLRVAELDRRALLRGRRHPLDEQVEERGRAEVLRRDPARDRIELVARHRVLQRVRDVLGRELLAFEVARHQVLVRLDDRVEQLLAVLLHLRRHVVRDRLRPALLAARRIHVRAHVQQVDDAAHLVLGADRQLDRDAPIRELRAHRLEHAEEVGALAVEHVDEDDARQLVLVGALPDARRVHLDAHHRAHRDKGALDDAERRIGVGLEAGVARAVDEVDLAVLPVDVDERARERHLPLVLVVVPVCGRRARVDRAEPVRLPRLKEQRLRERGLPHSAVADDGDVADLPRLGDCWHGFALLESRLEGEFYSGRLRPD